MDWERYGYVVASDYRKKIVSMLAKGEKTPAQMAEEAGIYLSHVCATLSDLTKKGLVTCLTPTLRRGKIYSLTKEGREVLEKLKELEELR
jgi:predicted transcriptional regulator